MEKVDIKELLKGLDCLRKDLEERRTQICKRLEKVKKLGSETLDLFPTIKKGGRKYRMDSLNKKLSELEKEINEIIEAEEEARKGDTRKAEAILKAREIEISALSQALFGPRL